MALPLFCKRLGNDLGLEALFGIHLLEPLVFLFKLLHPGHQRGVHAAELGPPFVERGRAHAMLAAQFGDGGAGFSLFEDGDNLAVGVTGDLHAELSKSYLENSTHKSACLQGGLPCVCGLRALGARPAWATYRGWARKRSFFCARGRQNSEKYYAKLFAPRLPTIHFALSGEAVLGRRTLKIVPPSSVDSTSIVPPWDIVISLAINRPSPKLVLAGPFWSSATDSCTRGSKIAASEARGISGP